MQSISEVNNSKILIFDSISNRENTIITSNKQSITLTANCGCQQTEHFLCGNTSIKNKENNTDLLNNRSICIYYIILIK